MNDNTRTQVQSSTLKLQKGTQKLWLSQLSYETLEKIEKDDGGKKKNGERTNTRTMLVSKTESLLGVLVNFARELREFKHHRYKVERCNKSYTDMVRSFRPGQRLLLMDFSENYTIIESKAIQSNHWISVQASLHIGIEKRLDEKAWTDGDITLDSEVTVLDSNQYATVREITSDGKYALHDISGTFTRSELGLRCWICKSHISVSDDKKKDSSHVDAYLDDVIKAMSGDGATFTSLHLHTDNAPQHYKNTKTMFVMSCLPKRFDFLYNVTWSFGCPGHGKGPWYVILSHNTCTYFTTFVLLLQGWNRCICQNRSSEGYYTKKSTPQECRGCVRLLKETREYRVQKIIRKDNFFVLLLRLNCTNGQD